MISSLYCITNENLIIWGPQKHGFFECYKISLYELPDILTTEGRNYSLAIMKMADNEWVEMRHLYFLAQFIQKRFPSIAVDWEEQFIEIETTKRNMRCKKEFLKQKGLLREPKHSCEESFENWWIELNSFIHASDTNESICQRVKDKLKKSNMGVT